MMIDREFDMDDCEAKEFYCDTMNSIPTKIKICCDSRKDECKYLVSIKNDNLNIDICTKSNCY
jgi:hypothetical protein